MDPLTTSFSRDCSAPVAFDNLPDEVLVQITLNLEPREWATVQLSCRNWRRIAKDKKIENALLKRWGPIPTPQERVLSEKLATAESLQWQEVRGHLIDPPADGTFSAFAPGFSIFPDHISPLPQDPERPDITTMFWHPVGPYTNLPVSPPWNEFIPSLSEWGIRSLSPHLEEQRTLQGHPSVTNHGCHAWFTFERNGAIYFALLLGSYSLYQPEIQERAIRFVEEKLVVFRSGHSDPIVDRTICEKRVCIQRLIYMPAEDLIAIRFYGYSSGILSVYRLLTGELLVSKTDDCSGRVGDICTLKYQGRWMIGQATAHRFELLDFRTLRIELQINRDDFSEDRMTSMSFSLLKLDRRLLLLWNRYTYSSCIRAELLERVQGNWSHRTISVFKPNNCYLDQGLAYVNGYLLPAFYCFPSEKILSLPDLIPRESPAQPSLVSEEVQSSSSPFLKAALLIALLAITVGIACRLRSRS